LKLIGKTLPPALIAKIKLGVFLLFPFALFLLPLHTLDTLPSVCLIKLITGHECPGCGMTHAVLNVIHLQFTNAFNYNKLVVVIFPLLSYIWLLNIANNYKKLTFKSRKKLN
jgi:hypothetical protein